MMDHISLPEPISPAASVDEAKTYVRALVRAIGPGFHPDTSAEDYVNALTGKPSFTAEQCAVLSEGLARVDAILLEAGIDICAVALPVQRKLLSECR